MVKTIKKRIDSFSIICQVKTLLIWFDTPYKSYEKVIVLVFFIKEKETFYFKDFFVFSLVNRRMLLVTCKVEWNWEDSIYKFVFIYLVNYIAFIRKKRDKISL